MRCDVVDLLRALRAVALLSVVGHAACATPSGSSVTRDRGAVARDGESARLVYVTTNGWHTGIVVARADIPPGRWPEHADFSPRRYIEVGWGDRAAYVAPRITARLAVAAALWSPGSVLHVTGFDGPITDRYEPGQVRELWLTATAFLELVRFLEASYARDGDRAVALGPGLIPGSAFYPATGRYHLFNTCNSWTARALRAAGCTTAPALALTADQLMEQVATRCPRAGTPAAGAEFLWHTADRGYLLAPRRGLPAVQGQIPARHARARAGRGPHTIPSTVILRADRVIE